MNTEEIKKQAEQYKQSPPADTWQKIDYLLQSRSNVPKRRTRLISILSYAAVFLLLIATVFLFKPDTEKATQLPVFEHNAQPDAVSPLYSNTQMDGLRKAYAKVFPDQTKGI